MLRTPPEDCFWIATTFLWLLRIHEIFGFINFKLRSMFDNTHVYLFNLFLQTNAFWHAGSQYIFLTGEAAGHRFCREDAVTSYAKLSPEVFYEKVVLNNFAKFTGKHLCWSLFQSCNPVLLWIFYKCPFWNTSWLLLLSFLSELQLVQMVAWWCSLKKLLLQKLLRNLQENTSTGVTILVSSQAPNLHISQKKTPAQMFL